MKIKKLPFLILALASLLIFKAYPQESELTVKFYPTRPAYAIGERIFIEFETYKDGEPNLLPLNGLKAYFDTEPLDVTGLFGPENEKTRKFYRWLVFPPQQAKAGSYDLKVIVPDGRQDAVFTYEVKVDPALQPKMIKSQLNKSSNDIARGTWVNHTIGGSLLFKARFIPELYVFGLFCPYSEKPGTDHYTFYGNGTYHDGGIAPHPINWGPPPEYSGLYPNPSFWIFGASSSGHYDDEDYDQWSSNVEAWVAEQTSDWSPYIVANAFLDGPGPEDLPETGAIVGPAPADKPELESVAIKVTLKKLDGTIVADDNLMDPQDLKIEVKTWKRYKHSFVYMPIALDFNLAIQARQTINPSANLTTQQWIVFSQERGGHCHKGGMPLGMTLKPGGGGYVKDALVKGNTDDKWVHRYQTAVTDNLAYGLKEIYYRAAYNNEEDGDGRIGGVRQFVVTSSYVVNAQHLTANTELTVKVPWLVLLPTVLTPNGNYLSGGRNDNHSANHYGPVYDLDQNQNYFGTSYYPNGYAVDCNHWGDPQVITILQNIAAIFKTEFKERLYLNDIGLVYGGKFDVAGTWEGFHASHYDGKSVDFNPQKLNINSPAQAWQNWRKKLQDTADGYLEIYRYNDPHDSKQYQLAADVALHISDNHPPIIHADFTKTEVEE